MATPDEDQCAAGRCLDDNPVIAAAAPWSGGACGELAAVMSSGVEELEMTEDLFTSEDVELFLEANPDFAADLCEDFLFDFDCECRD